MFFSGWMARRYGAALAVALAAVTGLLSCSSNERTKTLRGPAMGSTFSVTVVDAPRDLSMRSIERAIADILATINSRFSNWDPDSEISMFNRQAAVDPLILSPAWRDLLDTADEIHLASEGTFDLTLGPLVELWGFGAPGPRRRAPADSLILDALQHIGQRRVLKRSQDGSTLIKVDPKATLYVAGIAKGTGIDAIAAELTHLGVQNFMVEIGGDLVVSGNGPSGAGWRIAVEKPVPGIREVEEIIVISDVGVATSGDYRNYFEENGVRYSHILDGRTGRPVTHRTASVTVVAQDGATADAWATALLAMGRERGLKLAETMGLAALFIDKSTQDETFSFERYASPAFEIYRRNQHD
ncbi:MAG: FAD:protein FMN transferase [Pseudomonadota bacterium]